MSVYQRYDKGFSNWRDDGLDILGIVGNLFAAGWIRQVGIGFSQNSNGIQAGKYLLLGQVATDAASGLILTEDALQKIQAVQQNSQLTASEKTRQIAELLRSLALATTLTYISLKGSQADMAMLKANQPEVMIDNQILRLEVEAEQGVVDLEAKVEIPERDDGIVGAREGDGGIVSDSKPLMSSDGMLGVEPASQQLINSVSQRRSIAWATEGSEELRLLQYFNAEASVSSDALGRQGMSIILKPNPSKPAVLEEFLHGSQHKLGLPDKYGTEWSEVHVKSFMLRHQSMLGIGTKDAKILNVLLQRDINELNQVMKMQPEKYFKSIKLPEGFGGW